MARPTWNAETPEAQRPAGGPITQEALGGRRSRTTDAIRKQLEEVLESIGARDLEKVLTFAEFVKARRAARTSATRTESAPSDDAEKPSETGAADYEPPSSKQRTAAR